MTTLRPHLRLALLTLAPLLACVVPACCPKALPAPIAAPSKPAGPAEASTFRVGTWRVDLTPPPGVSTFGHGPDSLVTDGYWSRIYCRIFVLASDSGERVALVPCDLSATSKILHRSIAARVAQQLPPGTLPATRIFVSSTHTHAGPAHYFDGDAYSGPESTHMPGYDQAMVDFLANRIGDGIVHALAAAKPAALRSWHYEPDHDPCPLGDCGTWGLAWNRSLRAHARDPVHEPGNPVPSLCPYEQQIDPSMHVVRFDEVTASGALGAPIGEIVSFAMHPSVLPNTNRLIGADSAGALSRILERRLRVEANAFPRGAVPPDPLAAVLNTNEGDISPAWKEGTKAEALSIAAALADRVKALTTAATPPRTSVPIDARYVETDLVKIRTSGHERTCETAEVGLSVAYGACDHPTTSTAGIPPSFPPDDGDCQSPKVTPLGFLENLLAGGPDSFPQVVPLGVVRIDDDLVAYVPAELTIDAGRRVDEAVARAFGRPAHVWVGGLTNGDILYVATPEEYAYHGPGGACAFQSDTIDRQSYEAASTLYGAQTLPHLVHELSKLARALVSGEGFDGLDAAGGTYTASPAVSRLPRDANGDAGRHALSVCKIDERSLCFRWADAAPGGTAVTRAPWVYLGDPATGAGIHACDPASPACDPFEAIDDQGTSFVTRARTATAGETTWATVWHRTDEESRGLGASPAAFFVRDRAGVHPVVSKAFSASHPPPACDATELADCGTYEEPLSGPSPLPRGCQ